MTELRMPPTELAVSAPIDQAVLRETLGAFPSGVVALCAQVDGERVGMAVSSFFSVSLVPALAAVSIQVTSATWPVLRRAQSLGVSVLSESHHAHVRTLSSKTGDRFAGVETFSTLRGAVLLHDAAARIEASIESETLAGDHWIVVLRIDGLEADPTVEPLVFHRSRLRGVR